MPLPISFQVQIPSVASLQGRAGAEGPVTWIKNEDFCSWETEKVPKKAACSKASTKNFSNQRYREGCLPLLCDCVFRVGHWHLQAGPDSADQRVKGTTGSFNLSLLLSAFQVYKLSHLYPVTVTPTQAQFCRWNTQRVFGHSFSDFLC